MCVPFEKYLYSCNIHFLFYITIPLQLSNCCKTRNKSSHRLPRTGVPVNSYQEALFPNGWWQARSGLAPLSLPRNRNQLSKHLMAEEKLYFLPYALFHILSLFMSKVLVSFTTSTTIRRCNCSLPRLLYLTLNELTMIIDYSRLLTSFV